MSHSLGKRQEDMEQGGTTCSESEHETREAKNRHMGTLSISVHEDKEGTTKTPLP